MAIRRNNTTLNIDYVVSYLLSEDMRRKSMEESTKDSLIVKGQLVDRGKGKSFSGRSKSRGKSKSPRHLTRKCRKCGKVWHVKKHCELIIVEKRKGSNEN